MTTTSSFWTQHMKALYFIIDLLKRVNLRLALDISLATII